MSVHAPPPQKQKCPILGAFTPKTSRKQEFHSFLLHLHTLCNCLYFGCVRATSQVHRMEMFSVFISSSLTLIIQTR